VRNPIELGESGKSEKEGRKIGRRKREGKRGRKGGIMLCDHSSKLSSLSPYSTHPRHLVFLLGCLVALHVFSFSPLSPLSLSLPLSLSISSSMAYFE